eukprot:m.489409 g.489409  ORF g.489409 m.489409 type:complete len:679 (-) comp21767_c0_seq1:154-2190(-)
MFSGKEYMTACRSASRSITPQRVKYLPAQTRANKWKKLGTLALGLWILIAIVYFPSTSLDRFVLRGRNCKSGDKHCSLAGIIPDDEFYAKRNRLYKHDVDIPFPSPSKTESWHLHNRREWADRVASGLFGGWEESYVHVTLESLIGRRCLDWNPKNNWEGMLWNCKVSRGAWEEAEYQRLVLLPAPMDSTGGFHVRHAFRIAALTLSRRNEYRCLSWDANTMGVAFVPCTVELSAQPASEGPTQNGTVGDMEPQSDASTKPPASDSTVTTGLYWVFLPRTGRHKIFGELRPADARSEPTTMCLSRAATKVDPSKRQLLKLQVESCTRAVPAVESGRAGRNCLQMWTLPRLNTSRYMNRVESDIRFESPLPRFLPSYTSVLETQHTVLDERSTAQTAHLPARDSTTTTAPPRVLCWILTYPGTHANRAVAVNRTWGRRCDHLLFMSTERYLDLNIVELDLGGPEARTMIWTKTKLAWMYVYKHYRDQADWFVKADDDTYVEMDHMRQFLQRYNPTEQLYFGRQFLPQGDINRSYYSGGSGIVFSRGTLVRLGSSVGDNVTHAVWATPFNGPEDGQTSKTLRNLGIQTQRVTDSTGGELFMPMGAGFEQNQQKRNEGLWFYQKSPLAIAGPGCCSKQWIATHYSTPEELYRMDDMESAKCADTMPTEWPHWQLGESPRQR